MSDEKVPQLCYPYNLLIAVKGLTTLELPVKLTADIQAGFQYALSTLPDTEQELLRLYYAEGKSSEETAALLSMSPGEMEALRVKAVKKLRTPARWNYIQYGISGCLKRESAKQYHKGYCAGYLAGYRESLEGSHNGAPSSQADLAVLNQPIAFLNLSPRAFHCLDRTGLKYIGEIAAMEEKQILRIRNLGKVCADEIARALQANGVRYTAWYQFLL